MWVSFAPESRLILDFVLEPRKQYVADKLIKTTDKHLSDSKPLFVTDGLKFYVESLLNKYGKWIEFPKTGKRGRPRKPAIVPDNDLKYAQVVKNKQGKKLQKVEKRIIFGQNVDQSKISTSLLERQNLTFRQDNNRIARKTIGFSKKLKGLYNQMRLYFTHFNFCRDHRVLKNEEGILENKTPTEKCEITNRKWKFTELLKYRGLKNVN